MAQVIVHVDLAFIGCNAKGGGFAQASDTTPGAAACDMDAMAVRVLAAPAPDPAAAWTGMWSDGSSTWRN